MLGAIIGDIIGSPYEGNPVKTKDFPLFSQRSRFTDDTVCTVAIADSLLTGIDYAVKLKEYYHRYPHAGYGGMFMTWASSRAMGPYKSWGNGSAMRVSPVGFAFDTVEETVAEAKKSAEVTHNHPEGIKGAQAAAALIFLARKGYDKKYLKEFTESEFGYNLNRKLDTIRPAYRFDVSCRGSVPEAILSFLESRDYEDAVRNAVSLGGDSDTMACIAGGIAQAYYHDIPEKILNEGIKRLDVTLLKILYAFNKQFITRGAP